MVTPTRSPNVLRRSGSHRGHPGAIIRDRTWDDYSVGRDTVQAHLAALDLVYTGVIEDLRKAIDRLDDLDPVTQDMLIGHAGELEKFQWFVRAHLENAGGKLANRGRRPRRARPAARRRSHRSSSLGVLQGIVAHRLVGEFLGRRTGTDRRSRRSRRRPTERARTPTAGRVLRRR